MFTAKQMNPTIRSTVLPSGKGPRVLFVNHSSQMGGAEFVLLDIVPAFINTSTVFLFETGPLQAELDQAGVRTMLPTSQRDFGHVKRDKSLLRALPTAGSIASITRQIAAAARTHHVLYANSQKAFVVSAAAAALAQRPLVWHLHDILSREHFGTTHIKIAIWLANRFASRVIVPSQSGADAFVAAGGSAGLVRLVPNGVKVLASTKSRAALRTDLGLPSGFLFGVFSRLAPWKGQHVALQALVALSDAKCMIAGGPLFGEHAYLEELRRISVELGIAERVRFLGHRNDVPVLMQAMNAVVHPSVSPEPFGRTLVEAMLCRVPVIATNCGAAPDILNHGSAGFLVQPGDAAALAKMLQKLRMNPTVARSVCETAESRARTLFSVEGMQYRIGGVVDEVAKASNLYFT